MRNLEKCLAGALAGLALLTLPAVGAVGAQPLAGQESYDQGLYDALEWESVGPARGGRSQAVAGSQARPNEYYFGAAGGGLWKTDDGGVTWRPVTDGKVGSASVGAVQVCSANPDVVYIGMGETELRGNVQQGDGVYRSDDGGKTWKHLGLEAVQNVAKIRIHPDDCDVAWVAAMGVHSAPTPDRGVYKTSDGGESWRLVLNREGNGYTGAIDLTMDPNNPNLMYASLWEAWRKSWGMSSGGPGSGLFKSTDGGESWTEISDNPGLPDGTLGKIGVSVSPVNPDRVWALVEAEEGGVFRSDDGGATWTRTNEERKLRQRAFYYTRIYADPEDADVVYALNTGFYKSTDGGETFDTRFNVPHGDNHDLWIAPDNSDRMINSNDGGANVSVNGGRTWTDQDFPTAQFYRVITTEHFPYHICGAQQDNSTVCLPHKGWEHLTARGPGGQYFYSVGGCESGYIAPDPKDTDIFFAGCYGGQMTRYNHANGQEQYVNVWPENPMGQSAEDLVERVQWTYPIVFSPIDPNVLYTGTQKVWKSTDEGQSWTAISDDLTRAVDSTMAASGGPITKDQTGVETYATIFALAPSPHDPNVIWAGSDDGYVQVTRDGGRSWQNVTPPDAPYLIRINTIEVSPHTPGKAYVSGIRYLVNNDRRPYVWKTEDYGRTWTKIVSGIADDHFVRATREDIVRPGLLYAATEETVYISWNDGQSWHPLGMNLPNVQVSDLVVEDHDLVIATHGRSFWVMYGMDPLRQLTPEVAAADAWIFEPHDVVRDVDPGAKVYYYLSDDADKVTLEFMDSQGKLIRTFEGTPREEDEEERGGGGGFRGFGGNRQPSVEAGSHSFTWNLTYPGYTEFDNMIFWGASNSGPAAVPGDYAVRLSVDGRPVGTRHFSVKMDPRLEGVTVADLQARFDLSMKIRDRVSEANQAVIDIRSVKGQVDDRLDKTDAQEVRSLGSQVNEKLSGVEEQIYQVRNESNQDPLNFPIKLNNKLAALMRWVESGEYRPTEQSYEVFDYLSGLLQDEMNEMNLILQQDVSRLNEVLREHGLEPIETGELISQ